LAVALVGAQPAAADTPPSDQATPSAAKTTSGPGRTTIVELQEVQPLHCFPIPDPGGDPDPGDGGDCTPPPPPPPLSCGYNLTRNAPQRLQAPDTGRAFSRISWSATIDCSPPYEVRIIGSTRLVERTPGQPDGQPLHHGGQINVLKPPGQPAFEISAGFIDLYDDERYPAAQQAEVLLEYSLEVVRGSGTWGGCPEIPGLRNLACGGTGTKTATGIVGTYPFSTGVVEPPCTQQSWTWGISGSSEARARVFDQVNTTLAKPIMAVQWCIDARGSVRRASIIGGPSPTPKVQALTGRVEGDPTLKKYQVDSTRVGYRSTFSIIYTFATSYTINVLGRQVTYERNESCQVSVDVSFYGDAVSGLIDDQSTNPCRPWFAVNQ
jgi:hypothetical protein